VKAEKFIINRKHESARDVYQNAIRTISMRSKSESIVVTIQDERKSRSSQQNAYVHKLIGLIADKQGEDIESVKRQIKYRIGLIEQTIINGDLITEITSTASLDKAQFSAFIEEVIKVCEFLGITYPVPSFYGFDDKYFN